VRSRRRAQAFNNQYFFSNARHAILPALSDGSESLAAQTCLPEALTMKLLEVSDARTSADNYTRHRERGDKMKLNEEARLLLKLGHLRTLRYYTQDAQIGVTLSEFIADTEVEIVKLKPDPRHGATLH